jgi:hypothetical protein
MFANSLSINVINFSFLKIENLKPVHDWTSPILNVIHENRTTLVLFYKLKTIIL